MLVGDVFISLSFWRHSFARYRILDRQFFLWVLWMCYSTPFWLLLFLLGNLLLSCWNSLVTDQSFWSWCFRGFLLFVFLQFLIFLLSYVYGSLCVYLSWSSFSFLDVYINIFQEVWEVFSHYLFKYFSAPFSFSSPPVLPLYICWCV